MARSNPTPPGREDSSLSRYHALTVSAVRRETAAAVEVTLDPPAETRNLFAYRAGQHLNVRARVEGEWLRRSYSICSGVQEGQLRILIKRQPGGRFSTWAQEQLQPGDAVEALPPAGRFGGNLAGAGGCYLAVAAGSGITPILAILKSTLAMAPQSRFALWYGNRRSSDILFREELAALKDRFLTRFSLLHVLSAEPQDLELFEGRLTPERCLHLLRHWGPAPQPAGGLEWSGLDAIFLCGPGAMNRDLQRAFCAWGCPADRIQVEEFASSQTTAARPREEPNHASGEAAVQVRIRLEGRQYRLAMPRHGETLLEAALRSGLDVRYSCKGGVCATCRAKLVQGSVRMKSNAALSEEEMAQGAILTCQSYPTSALVEADFDQD